MDSSSSTNMTNVPSVKTHGIQQITMTKQDQEKIHVRSPSLFLSTQLTPKIDNMQSIDALSVPSSLNIKPHEDPVSGKIYSKIPNDRRKEFIDAVENKGQRLKEAADRLGINYSSAKSIYQVYKKEGRIDKKAHKNKVADEILQNNLQLPLDSSSQGQFQYIIPTENVPAQQDEESPPQTNSLLELRDRLLRSRLGKRPQSEGLYEEETRSLSNSMQNYYYDTNVDSSPLMNIPKAASEGQISINQQVSPFLYSNTNLPISNQNAYNSLGESVQAANTVSYPTQYSTMFPQYITQQQQQQQQSTQPQAYIIYNPHNSLQGLNPQSIQSSILVNSSVPYNMYQSVTGPSTGQPDDKSAFSQVQSYQTNQVYSVYSNPQPQYYYIMPTVNLAPEGSRTQNLINQVQYTQPTAVVSPANINVNSGYLVQTPNTGSTASPQINSFITAPMSQTQNGNNNLNESAPTGNYEYQQRWG